MEIGTDGSAIKNPGPTGWAWVAADGTFETGGERHSTNNVAELTAILRAVQAHPSEQITVYTDSQYAQNCILTWGPKWIRQHDTQRKNFDLIAQIIETIGRRPAEAPVTITWVRSHQDDNRYPLNTAADQLANAAGHRSAKGADPVLRGHHEIDWERREVAKAARSGWMNQSQLGKAHGMSAREVGKLLESRGLKVGSLGTEAAYESGIAIPTRMKDGTEIASWDAAKFDALIAAA